MTTIHFIHGIHPGRQSATDKLAKFYVGSGYKIKIHNYGFAWALPSGAINWLNDSRAKKIAKDVKEGDVIVAHSNGCAIAYLIQKKYVKLSSMVLFQPALDNDVTFDNVGKVLVIYNIHDEVVDASRFYGVASAWGDMGRVGYHGSSENVSQWDSEIPPLKLPPYSGHTDFTLPVNVEEWSRATLQWIEK